jgi:hypothetical protein
MWRNTWLLLVDSVKLFDTVSAYKLNPNLLVLYITVNLSKTGMKLLSQENSSFSQDASSSNGKIYSMFVMMV